MDPAPATSGAYLDVLTSSLLVLLVVCALAGLVLWLRGRGGGGVRGARYLEVLDQAQLAPRRSLHVVEVAGKTLLLGASENGLALICELDGALLQPVSAPPSLVSLLRSTWAGRGTGAGDAGAASESPDPRS
jgi:flagellar biosynthetic protein FliO